MVGDEMNKMPQKFSHATRIKNQNITKLPHAASVSCGHNGDNRLNRRGERKKLGYSGS